MRTIATLSIRPGEVTLADWREVYRGVHLALDSSALPAIEAGADAVSRIVEAETPVNGVNTGLGNLRSVRISHRDLERLQRNLVLSHAAGTGAPVEHDIVRLMMALKLGNLGQGVSGARLSTVRLIEEMLARDIVPVIPSQGSVGGSDLVPLAHMAAAMIGVGDVDTRDGRRSSREALALAGLEPLVLAPKEGFALLGGSQFSTAHALAAIFETERLFQCALVTGALSTEAAKGCDAAFDPRLNELRGHRGQIEVAAALRALMAGSDIRDSPRENHQHTQIPSSLRSQPQVMGAALDLLRQAADTLETEANGVTDNPLVLANDEIALSGGNVHGQPVAFAADMIALAICEIGALAERRIAMLIDPEQSGLPAFLTPKPGLNSGFRLPQVTAAALVAENRQRATPASIDPIPASASQEDHVSMAAYGSRRLLRMIQNLRAVIAIELLCAAQGCDFHMPLPSSEALEEVRFLVRREIPYMEEDVFIAPDIERAITLIQSGAILAPAQGMLPAIVG